MDLHQKEIQGFFSFPVDNLRASPFLIQYIQEEVINPSFVLSVCVLNLSHDVNIDIHFPSFCQIPDYRNAIIVAKSPSAAKR